MKNKEYEAWVSSFVGNLSEHFNLAGWRITLEFSDEQESDKHGDLTAASIHVTSDYQMATIILGPVLRQFFEDGELDQIIQSLTHELVHIFLAPFQEWIEPHLSATTAPLHMKVVEQQTQRLTSVFLKTLPKHLIPKRPNGKHNPVSKDNRKKPAVH